MQCARAIRTHTAETANFHIKYFLNLSSAFGWSSTTTITTTTMPSLLFHIISNKITFNYSVLTFRTVVCFGRYRNCSRARIFCFVLCVVSYVMYSNAAHMCTTYIDDVCNTVPHCLHSIRNSIICNWKCLPCVSYV